MDAWMSYEEHFDYATGTPKAGKETEAWDFVNVVNTETEEIGFAIEGNTVIAHFCPAASRDPEILMATVASEGEPPVLPEIPADLELFEGSPCPELDDTGRRPNCGEGNCCGRRTNVADPDNWVDECKGEFLGASVGATDAESWTMECYEEAKKIIASFAAIASIVASIM